jgi:hypothetical protein
MWGNQIKTNTKISFNRKEFVKIKQASRPEITAAGQGVSCPLLAYPKAYSGAQVPPKDLASGHGPVHLLLAMADYSTHLMRLKNASFSYS